MTLTETITLKIDFTNSKSNKDDLMKINIPLALNPRSEGTYVVTHENFNFPQPPVPRNTKYYIYATVSVLILLGAVLWIQAAKWKEATEREARGEKYSKKALDKMRAEFNRLKGILKEVDGEVDEKPKDEEINHKKPKHGSVGSGGSNDSNVFDPLENSVETEDSEVLSDGLLEALKAHDFNGK